jgi:hypothetical protein
MASRVWPMTSFSASASAGKSKVLEPMSSQRPAAATNGIAKRPPEQSQPAATASLAEGPKPEASPVAPLVLLNARTVEQVAPEEKSASDNAPRASKTEHSEVAEPEAAHKKKPPRVARAQKTPPAAAPTMTKSASANASLPRDPALREFMSTPSRN